MEFQRDQFIDKPSESIRRICSNEQGFELKCEDLKGWLKDRGFDSRLVSEQVDRAKVLDRTSLLDKDDIRETDTRINHIIISSCT